MEISPTLLLLTIIPFFLLAFIFFLFSEKKRLARTLEKTREEEGHLKNEAENYRQLAGNIDEVIYVVDLATLQYTYVSPSVIRSHGFTSEEIVGLTIDKLLTPHTLEQSMKILGEEIEKDSLPGVDPDRYLTLEMEQYRKDGSIVLVETTVKFLRNEAGYPVSIVGVARDITERKNAETALRKSESLYRLLADNISEVIFIIELETFHHTYASPSVKNIFGYAPEEVLALPIDKLLTPESLDRTATTIAEEVAWDAALDSASDRIVILELEVYRKDGSTLWVETSAKALRDDSGKPVALLGVTRDITERKKTETALRENEQLYRLLADNITETISIISLDDLSHQYISPSIEKMRGFTPEELLAQPFDQIFTPRSYQLAIQTIAEELEKESLPGVDPDRYRILELEQYRKDGSILWTEVVASFLRDETGRPVSVLAVARNISERKKAEKALRESEKLYRMLADNISELIYILDLDRMRYTFVSPSVQHLFGYTPEEFLQLPLDRVIAPSSYDRSIQAIAEQLKIDGQPGVDPDRFDTFELEVSHRDGSIVWAESVARLLRDDNGRPISILGVIRDITERKKNEDAMAQARDAAEAASRAKSEFLANMSHEIRTPMNGVIGMTELLLDTPLSAEQSEYAEIVKSSAESLLVIINDVLDFSKIEAGQLKLEVIDFELRRLCREVHDTVLPRAKRKQIAYNTIIADGVPVCLKGDRVRLRQILINLCENAVKFTEAGSVTVTISLDKKTDRTATLVFTVSDTGIGIPPEQHQAIFHSFSQVDPSTTRRFGGTGLGLAISKQLVSLMGGEISVASEPDKGATFRFTVTFEKQNRQAPSVPVTDRPPFQPAENMGPLKILLVEDNTISQKVISQMLKRLGHVIAIAGNGSEAVEMFGQQKFDLVLMDIQMPVMDGITATKKIHGIQRENSRKVPVIALTANAMTGDRERFLNQGMNDYIAKPITLETLEAVIRRNAD